jgi:sugar (pentulose or hexulose) kinase
VSLIGIDIGTSAVKVAAFSADGRCLASSRQVIPAQRGGAGQWEVDPADSVRACQAALAAVGSDPQVRRDPPEAVSFSSSGREVFPAAADGTPLGTCVMAADHRGEDVAARTARLHADAEWFARAGHVPRRMDPVNRIRWWQENHPEVTARARWFLNWHEYYALLMTGRAVTDLSSAAAWAAFDLRSLAWSDSLAAEAGVDPAWFPEVQRSGSPIGRVTPAAAAGFSLPAGTLVVTGAWDLVAAAVGQGAVHEGVLGLTAGTWHSFCLPAGPPWPAELARDGACVFPHPGPPGFAVGMFDPNGMSVVDWALRLFGVPEGRLGALLAGRTGGPGPVRSSAALSDLPDRRTGGGSLSGLRLGTTAADILQALLEGISLEFAANVARLKGRGYGTGLIRASGGGSKLPWLMQLHADLTAIPVEVVAEPEPGAHGAAVLAGMGTGAYQAADAAAGRLVRTGAAFEPSHQRRKQYAELLLASGADRPILSRMGR